MKARISVEQIRTFLEYSPDTGTLIWKTRNAASFYGNAAYTSGVANRWNRERAGKQAGVIGKRGYRQIHIAKLDYKAHRIAWAIYYGEWPSGPIDHINHVKDDNRITNLRIADARTNARNKSRASNNSSGETGVHFHRPSGVWHARINHDGGRLHVGAFLTKEEAFRARRDASERLGYHANHGAST